MKTKNILFKKITSLAIFIILLLNFLQFSLPVLAEDYGLSATIGASTNNRVLQANSDIKITVGSAIGKILAFVGILFFILMIYSGILWMTARGEEAQVTKAKDLIIAAIIGLAIVLSAYAITSYLGTSLITAT